MWLVIIGALVAAFAAGSVWLARARKLEWRSWLGAAALVAWVVGVLAWVHIDRESTARRTAAALAWPEAKPAAAAQMQPQPQGSTSARTDAKQVASVESLVSGLERRLEQMPNDPNGWALLAQSYAFMGDAEGAEKAIAKAVALGVDERTLRERIDAATRGPHAGSGG